MISDNILFSDVHVRCRISLWDHCKGRRFIVAFSDFASDIIPLLLLCGSRLRDILKLMLNIGYRLSVGFYSFSETPEAHVRRGSHRLYPATCKRRSHRNFVEPVSDVQVRSRVSFWDHSAGRRLLLFRHCRHIYCISISCDVGSAVQQQYHIAMKITYAL